MQKESWSAREQDRFEYFMLEDKIARPIHAMMLMFKSDFNKNV